MNARPLGDRFRQALEFASTTHDGQARKGTDTPYVSHLLSVAAIVLEQGGDEDPAIAALLHDAIEDQGGDPVRREIREQFGDRVERIVNDCTDAEIQPKPPWKERKEAYIAHIATAEEDSLLVSMADKLHNASSILRDHRRVGASVFDRFKVGPEDTVWYYRSLVEAFEGRQFSGDARALLDELKLAVDELERVAGIDPRSG